MTYYYRCNIGRLDEGFSESNSANLQDFEANYKEQATKLSSLILNENTITIEKSWSEFKSLVALVWFDVKYTQTATCYELIYFSDIEL